MGDATQVISRPSQTSVLPPVADEPKSGRKVWLGHPDRRPGRGGARRRRLPAREQPHGRRRRHRCWSRCLPSVDQPYETAKSQLEDLGLRRRAQVPRDRPGRDRPGHRGRSGPGRGREAREGQHRHLVRGARAHHGPRPDPHRHDARPGARPALEDAGLGLGSATQGASNDFEAGLIFEQDPRAGDAVAKGTLVDVVVSTGPEMVTVPDVSTQCLSIGGGAQRLEGRGARGDTEPRDRAGEPRLPEPVADRRAGPAGGRPRCRSARP